MVCQALSSGGRPSCRRRATTWAHDLHITVHELRIGRLVGESDASGLTALGARLRCAGAEQAAGARLNRAGSGISLATQGPVRPLYVTAALLPVVPALASVIAVLEPGDWSGVSGALVRNVTPDALLYSAVCAVVAAPLAGVAVGSWRRLTVATAIMCAVSAALTLARLGVSVEALQFVATSHAVLACATLALAALGALLGTVFRHPLDAAAVALGVALTAAYGVLVAGAPVGGLSTGMLKAALLASPVMTVATAAHVDLVRTDIWYQISPLAHIGLEYPTWSTVCGWYLLAGCAGFVASALATPKTGQKISKQGL